MMRVFVTGGSGLIGSRLVHRLTERGDYPIVLSRRAEGLRLKPAMRGIEVIQGDPTTEGAWSKAIDGCDAVVHLAGHNIFANRWDDDIKRKLRDSRIFSTENVVAAIKRSSSPPKVLVSGSAIGYYGPRGDESLSEKDAAGSDFMAKLCVEWEAAARPVEDLGCRLSTVRTGVVLAEREGALRVMIPVFRVLGGSPVGSGSSLKPAKGKQWMSWVHLEDIVGIFLFALDNPNATGPINGTAPNPLRNIDFAKALTHALRQYRPLFGKIPWPVFLPIGPPDALLNLVLGEVAQVIVTGQRVLPEKALALGYQFRYAELASALTNILSRSSEGSGSGRKHSPELAGVGS